MNYRQLIGSTVVPSSLSEESKSKSYASVVDMVNQMMPERLYRFRTCSERNLSAFYNDELWFSNGSVMNDDFDARLYYDKRKIKEWLNSLVDKNGCLKILNQLEGIGGIPLEISSIIPNAEYMMDAFRNMPDKQLLLISKQFMHLIGDNIELSLKEITELVQSSTKFACFSEKIYSDMMWGHYASNATGFALEYKLGKANVLTYDSETHCQTKVWGNLFPVIYDNHRIDTTNYAIYLFQQKLIRELLQMRGLNISDNLINNVVPCPDEFMVTKLAIKKSNDWKSEKEWRMFYTTNDRLLFTQQYSFVKQKPSAVYLGRKISDIHQKAIVDIAREKDIPVFKMRFNDNSMTYKLKRYCIQKKH